MCVEPQVGEFFPEKLDHFIDLFLGFLVKLDPLCCNGFSQLSNDDFFFNGL